MSRSGKRRRLARGRVQATRNKTPRYLVVTNGELTEMDLFRFRNTELGSAAILVPRFKNAHPAALADYAWRLNENEARGDGGDGFAGTFVVTDVDDFTVEQFREAQKTCDDHGFQFIVNNPCFEAWLIDHVEVCNERTTRRAQERAVRLGLVGGSGNKALNTKQIVGKASVAMDNARKHNGRERRDMRLALNSLDFAPWTDMVQLNTAVSGNEAGAGAGRDN